MIQTFTKVFIEPTIYKTHSFRKRIFLIAVASFDLMNNVWMRKLYNKTKNNRRIKCERKQTQRSGERMEGKLVSNEKYLIAGLMLREFMIKPNNFVFSHFFIRLVYVFNGRCCFPYFFIILFAIELREKTVNSRY